MTAQLITEALTHLPMRYTYAASRGSGGHFIPAHPMGAGYILGAAGRHYPHVACQCSLTTFLCTLVIYTLLCQACPEADISIIED
jgi:hypothetical protein